MGVQMYTIFGRKIGSQYLAIATLASTAALATWGLSGSGKPKEGALRDNASSKEEEEFIQEFIKAAEAEESKGKTEAKH